MRASAEFPLFGAYLTRGDDGNDVNDPKRTVAL